MCCALPVVLTVESCLRLASVAQEPVQCSWQWWWSKSSTQTEWELKLRPKTHRIYQTLYISILTTFTVILHSQYTSSSKCIRKTSQYKIKNINQQWQSIIKVLVINYKNKQCTKMQSACRGLDKPCAFMRKWYRAVGLGSRIHTKQNTNTHSHTHRGLQGYIKQMSADRFSLPVIEHLLYSCCVSLYQLPLTVIHIHSSCQNCLCHACDINTHNHTETYTQFDLTTHLNIY